MCGLGAYEPTCTPLATKFAWILCQPGWKLKGVLEVDKSANCNIKSLWYGIYDVINYGCVKYTTVQCVFHAEAATAIYPDSVFTLHLPQLCMPLVFTSSYIYSREYVIIIVLIVILLLSVMQVHGAIVLNHTNTVKHDESPCT